MRFASKLMIAAAALAMPLIVAAQAPPPGPGGPPPQAPAWGRAMGPGMGQRMGPQMGMGRGMGQRMGMPRGMGREMGRGMGMGQPRPGMARRLAINRMLDDPQVRERLKVTPEQVNRIRTQQSTFDKAMVQNRANLQLKHMELAELLRAEKPDRALIDKKLRELNDASFVARKAAMDHQLSMREMWTPEQRQEMEKMRGEFRGRMMQRWQGGPAGVGPRGPRPMGPPQQPPPPPGDNGE